jgi:hypothetical protein
VTRRPPSARQGPKGLAVHEEGLEPPHLAVPEPKSGWRVSRSSERACARAFGNRFATVRVVSAALGTIRGRLPRAAGLNSFSNAAAEPRCQVPQLAERSRKKPNRAGLSCGRTTNLRRTTGARRSRTSRIAGRAIDSRPDIIIGEGKFIARPTLWYGSVCRSWISSQPSASTASWRSPDHDASIASVRCIRPRRRAAHTATGHRVQYESLR